MKLVLAQKPELVAHFLRLFGSRNCSMTHRHLLLTVVVQAAKQLAGVEDNGEEEKPKVELIGEENSEKVNVLICIHLFFSLSIFPIKQQRNCRK